MAATATVPALDLGRQSLDATEVLARFDDLEAGQTLLVRGATPLRPVLLALRASRRGQFEWTPTREGPGYWESEVTRRASQATGSRRLGDVLEWDHERLDQLQKGAFAAWERGLTDLAWELYTRFANGLRRHIRVEETVVLPELERRLGLDGRNGAVATMRGEHRAIGIFLDRVCASGPSSLRDGGPAAEFADLLARHERWEDRLINHGLAGLLGDEESDTLAAAVQDLAPQA